MPETTTELSLTLSERHTADFEMIANGGFDPLRGFMGSEDWRRVTDEMRLASGEYWSIPITLATDLDCAVGDTVELRADDGKPLGRLTVEEVFERDTSREAEQVYRTSDSDHPGVAAIYEEGDRCIAGPIEADGLPDHEEAFRRRYLTPAESRQAFEERGWKRIVAFQTRNPIHRAHAPKFSRDRRFGLWKLNPIADWSEKDVWNYIREHRVPYNPLHDRNYPSIGCTHCTKPVGPGEDSRAGRWAGASKTECGIN